MDDTTAFTSDSTSTAAATPPASPVVTLDEPITRGSQTITSVTLRKPLAGDLRGCSLGDLATMEVEAIAKVLPRISDPTLTNADVYKLSAPDIMKFGTEILGFLLPKDAKASLAA